MARKQTLRARSDYRPAPKLGQHTREILREAGYADAQIESLIASGAACAWPA